MSGLQLLSPLSLLALIPLAGIIILLYLLRLRRREVRVSSTFLWRQAVQDVQANVPFQKLRRNLLLFLQLLALLLLVLSLGAPFFLSRRAGGHSVVLVMDASASMRATDVPGSRFEEARRQAVEMARGLRRADEMAVVRCGARPTVELPFSRDRRKLLAVLNDLQPGDGSTNVRDGLLLALSLAARRPEATVYLLSDGAFPTLPPVAVSAQVRFVCIGKGNDNVALLAFEVSRQRGKPQQQLFLRLRNFSDAPRSGVLSVYNDEELLQVERLELAGDENRVLTYQARLPRPGLLRAELDLPDALAADNVAYATAAGEGGLSVLLVSPANLFLEQGLLVQPEVSLYKATALPEGGLAGLGGKYDVVVLDGVALDAVPTEGGVLLFEALGAGAPASVLGPLEGPTISRWSKAHPALLDLNLSAVRIAQAQSLQPAPGAVPLASAAETPLIVARETPGARVLACGFSVLDTDWPLRVSFPVFLGNAVRWLAGAGSRTRVMALRPGQVIRAQVPASAPQAMLTLPDGTTRTLETAAGAVSFAGTETVGVYSLRAGEVTRRWAVDLRDGAESDLTPRRELNLGERQVVAGTAEPRREQHLWPWLVALALALLLTEWHVYHRRF